MSSSPPTTPAPQTPVAEGGPAAAQQTPEAAIAVSCPPSGSAPMMHSCSPGGLLGIAAQRQARDQDACFVWSPRRTSRQADVALQQPPAIDLHGKSVTAVGCVLGGKHGRPVPVYPMHLVLDAGVRAGGNLDGYGKKRAPPAKFAAHFYSLLGGQHNCVDDASQLRPCLFLHGKPLRNAQADKFGVTSLGARGVWGKMNVPMHLQEAVYVEPGHVDWGQLVLGAPRAGSSQPQPLASPRSASASPASVASAQCGQSPARRPLYLRALSKGANKMTLLSVEQWLHRHPDVFTELLMRNPIEVGDAVMSDGDDRLLGVKQAAVVCAMDGAHEKLRLLSAVIYHHCGAKPYDEHIWPVVLMLRAELFGMCVLENRVSDLIVLSLSLCLSLAPVSMCLMFLFSKIVSYC